MEEYPLHIALLESFYREGDEEPYAKYIRDRDALRERVVGSIYAGIDYSLFRGDIDGKAAVIYIKWLFDAYQQEVAERFRSGELKTSDQAAMEAEWRQFDTFTKDLRRLFYKEGQ
ncbi:MAG: hypothetical protein LBQ15_04540 [Clostridium sp.]|jgi:hypothetical protein|nr:hypothetical protein [Clostridium sp.]